MKIVNIIGGLGNQMFEYAMYLALRNAHPDEEILCSTRSFRGYGLHNGYELKRIFGINVKEASLWQLAKLAYPFWNYRLWQIMNHLLPKRKSMTLGIPEVAFNKSDVEREDSVFYDGYWQNEEYFSHIRQIILSAFNFPAFTDERNEKLTEKLKKQNSVACHIRRGDYLKLSLMCVCSPEYYFRAINRMNQLVNPEVYCIFSDDIAWCKEHIGRLCKDKEVIYVNWNKGLDSFRDMQLMSLCKHNIIANSSFSWWGGWLNQNENKVVLVPKKWMNKEIVNNPICKNWIKI